MKQLLRRIGSFMLLASTASAESALSTWEDVQREFASAGARKARSVSMMLSPALVRDLDADGNKLPVAAAKAGYKIGAGTIWSNGKVEIPSIESFGCPFLAVRTEAEMIGFIRQMRSAGTKRFIVVTEPALYKALRGAQEKHRTVLLKGGLYNYDVYYHYDTVCMLEYTGCRYWDGDVREVTGERELLKAAQDFGSRHVDAFAVIPDAASYQQLMANDRFRLQSLEAAAFLFGGPTTFKNDRTLIYYDDRKSVFYPGYVILQAVRDGRERQLPSRLQETLTKARQMTAGVRGSQSDMALAIHDLLCRHIRYEIDKSTYEDDCCIGAILNGRANCDGYSDAYYLLCGLKGIPVQLVFGHAAKKEKDANDTGHLWNLVLLDGVWRGVDVTWDTPKSGQDISYQQYNMGLDRMKQLYVFSEAFLPSNILRSTDLAARPTPEYRVSTAQEVTAGLRAAAAKGAKKAVFWMSTSLYREYHSTPCPMRKWLDFSGVSGSSAYNDADQRVVVSDIAPIGSGILVANADSEEGIVSLLRSGAGRKQMWIYCSYGLFTRYQAADYPIWKWLDLAGISASPRCFSEYRELVFSDIERLKDSILVLQADTVQDLVNQLKRINKYAARELRVYCSANLFSLYQSNQQNVFRWLKDGGVSADSVQYYNERRLLVCLNVR